MKDMLLGISPEYLYLHKKQPKEISDLHKPYFLAFCSNNLNITSARNELLKKWNENKSNENNFSKIAEIGEIENYSSFWDIEKERKVFKVFTNKSFFVPEVSDYLFFYHNFFTAEHDIPYQQRSLVDLAAEGKTWLFDSSNQKTNLKILVYDIETTKFEPGRLNIPIDIIGYSDFNIEFQSEKNLETEEFSFDILNCPTNWEDIDVKQLVSNSIDEEIKNLYKFCKIVMDYDIISGHNIIGFDNIQIYSRIDGILKEKKDLLSEEENKVFQIFISKYSRPDKSFYFGINTEAVQFYPCSLDTYLGVRKFYSFLDDFSLKSVAPFLGINIKDRIILTPQQIKIDDRTLKYNKQDVQEQLGVTLNLIQQVLPLSFTTCMPFDMLLSSGAVSMWDHMSLIRGAIHKKIMPPICRVMSISQTLLKDFNGCNTKDEIVKQAKKKKEQLSKDFVRVLKYGDEMPYWVEDPNVIYNTNASDPDERLNYHMPGGMTIKPDRDAFSHFVPWWYVVVADVGAMYPTILKAMNIGADTVRLAKENEKPDEYIWLKKIPKQFLDKRNINYREINEKDSFADKGYMLGVIIDKKQGVVNCAMTGIMSTISKIKKELQDAKKNGDESEIKRLKMMYQSLKGARNAGSVDFSQRVIFIDPDGNYKNIKIGEFVDNSFKKNKSYKEKINGVVFEIANLKDNWSTISVNISGKTEIKKIKQVVRHKWNEKLVKITTKSGFTIVTPNHSIYTLENNKIKEISANNINKDTLLIHAKKIPNLKNHQTINLVDEINHPGYFAFINKSDMNKFNGKKEKLVLLNLITNHSTPYIKIKIEDFKELKIKEDLLRFVKIGSIGRKSSKIPAIIPFDKRLAELIGYYISEGHISKKYVNGNPQYYITFSSSSEKMNHKIKKYSKELFGLNVYLLDRRETTGTFVTTLHAKIIDYLFENILNCGTNSRSKKVPYQILSSSNIIKKAFLKAYMEGNGNIRPEMPSSVPLGRSTTNSRCLNEDIITLQKQFGILTNTHFREEGEQYNTRMIGFFKGKRNYLNDCYVIPPKKIEYVNPSSEYVYDLSVEENENFIDSNGGILLHNTHGILAAPSVSGRQFNLWGAAAITTKGQAILADTVEFLKNRKIRVVYGDTDGLYIGCSRSVGNVPNFPESLGISTNKDESYWITKPDIALSSIEKCNLKWQKELNYNDFELEPEIHDAMIFVKHKNYLIFDSKKGKLQMVTKGNNFKGSDKANIARIALNKIMIEVLKENPIWDDEEEVRKNIRDSINSKTMEIISNLDLKEVSIDDLTLVQSVQPAKRYKPNQDGTMSTFGKRAAALEKLIGERIRSRIKLKFVVTKKPLPGIKSPSKSGVKPIDYMYPVDLLKDKSEIDLDWYKKMIENYIQGAFGLSDIALTSQTGLDDWM